MTRELIMKDYFAKRMRGERVNLESMINSLTKSQLIQLAKNDTIFIKSDWNKQQIAERIMGSIEHVIYAIECCTVRGENEPKQDFYKRVYYKYWA